MIKLTYVKARVKIVGMRGKVEGVMLVDTSASLTKGVNVDIDLCKAGLF